MTSCLNSGNKSIPFAVLSIVTKSNTDSLFYKQSIKKYEMFEQRVQVEAQTLASDDDNGGVTPEIWFNHHNSSESRILGTCQHKGLTLFDFKGNVIFHSGNEKINSIDVRYGFVYKGDTIDIAAVSNSSNKSIDLLNVSKSELTTLACKKLSSDTMVMKEAYGCCMYKSAVDSSLYVFISGKKGFVQQWKVNLGDTMSLFPVRILYFENTCKGMVADDENGILYVASERDGIYRVNAEPLSENSREKIALSDSLNQNLAYNLKGIDIYYGSNGRGYLIASSQGNQSYAVFNREIPNGYIGSFVVDSNNEIDGIENSEGICVFNLPLDSIYNQGVFVAHDALNKDTLGNIKNQNFKMIKWDLIAGVFKEKLEINTNEYPLFN